MMTIREYLEKQINDQLRQAVLSGSRGEGPSKVKIRPLMLKGRVCYQASATEGTKIFHKNYEREELLDYLERALNGEFSQLQAVGGQLDGTVLVSRKGKATIKAKEHPQKGPVQMQAHNRVKQYILKEGIPVPFLVDLGVMTREGRIVASKYDKFRQINRFLEFIQDVLPRLDRDREVTILDFGCGKSYLTFAMYYYLRELKGYDVRIIGLDLKEDVIRRCGGLAEKYGYEKLHFLQGDIGSYQGVSAVDMVVTLHACDIATDLALAKAVEWGAEVILSVPCCQHEVNRQIKNEMLDPILKYGILKERMAALITDGLRANLLEGEGYETQILEFIDMEHTPKNLLIRAVKTGKKQGQEKTLAAMEALHVNPALRRLLER
ncbi:MAG: SAM-dependent methyltransferase [Eubacteriales bacterium]|nr:SAM-dependent methyltransferase [Eubacteriales bacterium]